MSEQEPERELDRVYALPLGEFTAARNELAKRLRDEGRRDEAEQVRQARKPTAAAWLANRVALERELDVQRLLKAGKALAEAQANPSAEAFSAARREEHEALERLAQTAREIARRDGVGSPAIERAVQTLRAASLTQEGRELLKRGRLTEELEPPGFEALGGLPAAPRPAKGKAGEDADPRRAAKEARERAKQLRAEERRLAQEARAAARDAEKAEREAAALRERADEAEAAAAEVRERLAEAEREAEANR